MSEYILFIPLLVTGGVILLWPYFYISMKKGTNRFLFCSAVFGAVSIIQILLMLAATPAILFGVKFAPQLQEAGLLDGMIPLFHVAELMMEYESLVLMPILFFFLPPLFYRRYKIFRLNNR